MRFCQISLLTQIKGNVNANGTIGPLTEIKKFVTTEQETIVFVSGRCVKYCIKEKMKELDPNIQLSPITRGTKGEEKVLQSMGNPVEYIDDDLFGFMKTRGNFVRKRFAPIKTNGIIALRHCEITRDFLVRFDPERKEPPSPAEVEVADFIGRNDWIITDRVGKYTTDELWFVDQKTGELEKDEELKDFYEKLSEKTRKEDDVFVIKDRKERYRIFLNILLRERYTFPRAANYLNIPHYFFGIVYLGKRQLPIFSYVDYLQKENKIALNWEKLKLISNLLQEDEKIYVISYEEGKIYNLLGEELKGFTVDKIVDEIVSHLVQE